MFINPKTDFAFKKIFGSQALVPSHLRSIRLVYKGNRE